ncbi:MAG TPA: hypothetical protein VJ796_01595 [Acidimicrobiia bacterium]|nr:hypothetical protein [Acidimicrobiia bacterium]
MEDVRRSPEAKALLASVVLDPVYRKWRGAHWVIADLADIGHPPRAKEVRPLVDLVVDRWLGPQFFRETGAGRVPFIAGRYRRCGSIQGNALRSMVQLGWADDRAHQLAERLMHWQWPDGGWNCDRTRSADTSSFMETLMPMRGLAAYAAWSGDKSAAEAAREAAEVFLSRRLFLRRRDGKPMSSDFMRLHYPLYWHYDFLGGLVGMNELGLLSDPRCEPALELLEAKRLPDGGWPAEAKWYKLSEGPGPGISAVDWGGVSQKAPNRWVTQDAMSVLGATV